jgi:hypothetical protein
MGKGGITNKPTIEQLKKEVEVHKQAFKVENFKAIHFMEDLKQQQEKLLIVTELADLGTKTIQKEVSHILFQNILKTINKTK